MKISFDLVFGPTVRGTIGQKFEINIFCTPIFDLPTLRFLKIIATWLSTLEPPIGYP